MSQQERERKKSIHRPTERESKKRWSEDEDENEKKEKATYFFFFKKQSLFSFCFFEDFCSGSEWNSFNILSLSLPLLKDRMHFQKHKRSSVSQLEQHLYFYFCFWPSAMFARKIRSIISNVTISRTCTLVSLQNCSASFIYNYFLSPSLSLLTFGIKNCPVFIISITFCFFPYRKLKIPSHFVLLLRFKFSYSLFSLSPFHFLFLFSYFCYSIFHNIIFLPLSLSYLFGIHQFWCCFSSSKIYTNQLARLNIGKSMKGKAIERIFHSNSLI